MTEYLDFKADLAAADAVSAYDELPLWSSLAGSLLLDHVPLTPPMRVLDVGCGTGFPLLTLAQRLGPSSHVTGIDIWDEALDRARAKAATYGVTNVEIRHADAASLPFDDASFDLIVSNLGLNNFADAAAAMRECARVLRPAGRIAITTNLQGHMREFYVAFDATLSELGDDAARARLAAHVAHRATIQRVTDLFARAGLAVTAVREQSRVMRFAGGSALLRDYFIKLGFLGAWKDIVDEPRRPAVFDRLERNLNALAANENGLTLTIPLAYIEGARSS